MERIGDLESDCSFVWLATDKAFSSKLLFPHLKLGLLVPSYWEDYMWAYVKTPDMWWLPVVAIH